MIEEYQGIIYSVVRRVVNGSLGQEEVKDIVQDVNLRLLDASRRPDHDPSRGEISQWICAMAKSMSLDALRKHGRRAAVHFDESASASEDHVQGVATHSDAAQIHQLERAANDALSMLLREEQRSVLAGVVGLLSEADREFLAVSLRDDYCADAYAAEIGVKPVALRVRKLRLSEKIRTLLASTKS